MNNRGYLQHRDEHLTGIAGISRRYPLLCGIELLPYHDLGVAKADALGKDVEIIRLNNTGDATKQIWLKKLKQFGCSDNVSFVADLPA